MDLKKNSKSLTVERCTHSVKEWIYTFSIRKARIVAFDLFLSYHTRPCYMHFMWVNQPLESCDRLL